MRDSREYSRKEAACERNPYYGEYRGRQIPRRMRENERGAFHGRGTFPGKKRRMMGFVIVCLLLAMNIFLLLELGERVRGLDTELDEVMGRIFPCRKPGPRRRCRIGPMHPPVQT